MRDQSTSEGSFRPYGDSIDRVGRGAPDAPTREAFRWVDIPGMNNVRDLGGAPTSHGIPTARGVLYRADGPDYVGLAGVAAVRALGIKTIIDLRTPEQFAEKGCGDLQQLVDSGEVRRINVPIEGGDTEVGDTRMREQRLTGQDIMTHYLLTGTSELRRFLEIAADPDTGPILFHCQSGRDRTGVSSALVLAIAGVDHGDIALDYSLTAERLDGLEARQIRNNLAKAAQYDELADAATNDGHLEMASRLQSLAADERLNAAYWPTEDGQRANVPTPQNMLGLLSWMDKIIGSRDEPDGVREYSRRLLGLSEDVLNDVRAKLLAR